MLLMSTPSLPDCRTVVVPRCEPDTDASQGAPILALATFQMYIRDNVDFTVDFSQWLAANGGAQLSAATFAVAADSPKTPTISGQAFSAAGKCSVVLKAGVGATPGDAFYLDVTVTVAATTAVLPTDVAIPARTLVRRIHVVLVNG